MPIYVDDVKKWRALQFNEAWIYFNGESCYLRNLKKGSVFEFNPITTQNDTGGQTIVAWKLTAKIIVIQNNYEELMTFLRKMSDSIPIFIAFELSNHKGFDDSSSAERLFINFVTNNQEVLVKDYNLIWSIKQNEIAPELTIDIIANFSKDLIELTNLPIFKQYDWQTITWS